MSIHSKDANKKGEVLHSWKRIANYLNRSVRTARRWEEFENLPVRRHKHLKSNTVFAYTGELDNWLQGREQPSPNVNQDNDMTNPDLQPMMSWNRGVC